VIAFWLVLRFNLFCSLRSSFSQLPELRQGRSVTQVMSNEQ